jgi:hypothetical protein
VQSERYFSKQFLDGETVNVLLQTPRKDHLDRIFKAQFYFIGILATAIRSGHDLAQGTLGTHKIGHLVHWTTIKK